MPGIMHRMRALFPLAALLVACSPALDWRELRPEDSGAVASFPCKPASHARRVPLGGAPVLLTLHSCQAAEVTWALAVADVGDPARVGAALQALREGAAANIGAGPGQPLPLAVEGATPQPAAGRLALEGRRTDGQPVRTQVAVFAKGTRVYQATAIGSTLPDEAMEAFFGGLKTP